MRIIGITGPTGAGKTTLLREITARGGYVIDCDAVYHGMLDEDGALRDRLESEFGPLGDGNGRIDRKKLAGIVFSDPDNLAALNRITWPAVTARVRDIVKTCVATGADLVAVDAFALLESGLRHQCDTTVAVLAPVGARVERVMARDGISREKAMERIRTQKTDAYYIAECDHVLYNSYASEAGFARAAGELLDKII